MEEGWSEVEKSVWRRVPKLSGESMSRVPLKRHLGEGSFGRVDRVWFLGHDAIRKCMKGKVDRRCLLWEAWVTLELDGAGGAPRIGALTPGLDGVIMEYAGVPYYKYCYKHGCTVGTVLRVMLGVAERLSEVHAKGFIHNDLKNDNITVSGPASGPCVHVIDFGLASKPNDSFYFELFGMPRGPKQHEHASFRSPELRRGEPLQPSSDVFSVGMLLQEACEIYKNRRLTKLLWPLVDECTEERPEKRPSLSTVQQDLRQMLDTLSDEDQKMEAFSRKGM